MFRMSKSYFAFSCLHLIKGISEAVSDSNKFLGLVFSPVLFSDGHRLREDDARYSLQDGKYFQWHCIIREVATFETFIIRQVSKILISYSPVAPLLGNDTCICFYFQFLHMLSSVLWPEVQLLLLWGPHAQEA